MNESGKFIFNRAATDLEDKVERASKLLGQDIGIGAKEGVKLKEPELTPLKPNTARSVAQVRVAGEVAGDLYVIIFNKGDSTGEYSEEYPQDSLEVPPLNLSNNIGDATLTPGSASYPRPKSQLAEICIPLVNAMIWPDERVTMYGGTQLRLIGVNNDDSLERPMVTPIDLGSHGVNKNPLQAFSKAPSFMTLGTDSFGRRVGDPHAVFNPSENVQIAGFIAATDERWLDLLASFEPINPYAG
jgi:hypothetical protein